jgi:dipeptidyl aminopeptidase/acylaminoacyl peptidase
MSIRFKASLTILIVLILIAACGQAEPTVAPVPPTATLAPSTPTPTRTPIPPTDTPIPPTETATSVPTETAIPLPTATPATPDDLKLDVPLGNPATIDGTLSPAEWSGARTVELANGELLFMHDGTYMYLGIRSDVPGLGSICVDRGDTVAVLHSSASLGTAIYEKSGEDWQRTRDFTWTRSYGSHLEREGWLASDVNMGAAGEMEYQIAMPEGVMRLAVTVLKETDFTSPTVWPAHLADGCREVRLLQGYAPARMQLSPETWMTVVASATPAPAATQMTMIAFDGDDGINVMDVAAALEAGRDIRRLLIDDAFGAAWSPDGTQIAFASARDGGRMGIFVMDAEGGDPRRVTDDTLGGIGPTWSPDGTQIAFITDQGGNWDIYLINADGSDPRRLTFDNAIDDHPRWSPDGSHIAFMSERSGNPDIYVLNVAEGGEPGNLTQNPAVDAAPDWSPDGSQIVFYSDRGGGAEGIYIMDSDGSNVVQWTNSRAGDWHPAWSPNGSQIAFVSFRSHQDGDAEIYVMDLAGGPESEGNRPQRLTYSPSHDENPAWRPAVEPSTDVDATGSTWIKTYGGTQDDVAWDALLAEDGDFYIVGATNLEYEPEMKGDLYLIRTDAAGEVLWEKTYGGEGYEEGKAIIPSGDGGLMIAGTTSSFGAGGQDAYLVKVDWDGNELWSRTFGGPLDEMVSAVHQTADDGYLLIGNVVNPDDFVVYADESGYGGFEGRSNIYLVKTDGEGNELWSHAYDSENNILASAGLPTPDGGFLILATVLFFPEPDEDVYLLKVDQNGEPVWSRTWEEGIGTGYDFVSTADGNYLIAGSQAPPGDIRRLRAGSLFLKVDPSGDAVWRIVRDIPEVIDFAAVLAETADGGFVAAGGAADIPLVKIDAGGELLWQKVIETGAHGLFAAILQHPDGGYAIAGSTFNSHDFDVFLVKVDNEGNTHDPGVDP